MAGTLIKKYFWAGDDGACLAFSFFL